VTFRDPGNELRIGKDLTKHREDQLKIAQFHEQISSRNLQERLAFNQALKSLEQLNQICAEILFGGVVTLVSETHSASSIQNHEGRDAV
jgi:hypothetical protein